MYKAGDDSDDSDLDMSRSPEREENVRCTYIVRRDPPNRKLTLTPMQMRERIEMKKAEMKRENYPIFRGRYDSDEEEYAPSLQGRDSPPITTSYRRKDREVIPIRELIEKPWRHRRPSK